MLTVEIAADYFSKQLVKMNFNDDFPRPLIQGFRDVLLFLEESKILDRIE